MKKLILKFSAFLLLLCLLLPSFAVQASASAVGVTVDCGGDAYVGGELRIKITVSKPSLALAGLEFVLKYDSEYVSPLITENTEDGKEMDALVSKMPDGWEQMSIHYADGSYRFRFAMNDDEKSLLDSENELSLEIPFAVKKAGSFDFVVPDAEIIAIASDNANTPHGGTGSSVTVYADSEAQKLSTELIGTPVANEKGTYNLDIKITNLGDTAGIVALQFALVYDKSVFLPTVTENDSAQMDVFMKDMPQGKWEQMCSLDKDKGIYTLRFAALKAESVSDSEKLTAGSSLTITIPFKTVANEGEIGSFSISGASVLAINNINGIVSGSGSSLSVSVEKSAEGIIPEELGYKIENGVLCYVSEKTEVDEFLSALNGFTLTDANGKEVSGYVCTGYVLSDGINSYIVAVLGDVNGSGVIETYDYILATRVHFGTFTPNEHQKLACDANGDKVLNQYDYILIKRHYFGTYVIK